MRKYKKENEVKALETLETVIINEKIVPIFYCRKENNRLTFICPVCKDKRHHGAAEEFGAADGHRWSHCIECWKETGYILKEKN